MAIFMLKANENFQSWVIYLFIYLFIFKNYSINDDVLNMLFLNYMRVRCEC